LSRPHGSGPGWRLVLVLTLIGLAIGFGWGIADRPVYRATATVVVESDSQGSDPARLGRFAERGESEAVARRATAILGRDVPGADLLADTTVTPARSGGLLIVSAEAEAPDVAAAAADGLARALVAVEGDPLALGAAATIPAGPVEDRSAGRWAGIGGMVGLLIGLIVVGVGRRERRPTGAADGPAPAAEPPRWLGAGRDARIIELGPDPARALATDESGAFAIAPEAVPDAGMLADSIGIRSGSGPRSLAVVPAAADAGAVELAAVLAIAAAGAGRRVLVVEADLHRPALATRLEVAPAPGLADYLAGDAAPRQVLRTVAALPAGFASIPAGDRAAGIGITGSRFAALVDRLTRAYELVICVAPPLLGSDDAAAVGEIVDAVVVASGPGGQADLDRAADLLRGAPVWALVTATR
jgi:Mrp family chromosome partitioning ATPase